MNLIEFMTGAGAPLAMLGLSMPAAPQRDCIFMIHPRITSAVFDSREGQVIFPDRPTEYPCSYIERPDGTEIAFTNQNGWRFAVRIAADNKGTWTASMGRETVSGRAASSFGDSGQPGC